jgi:hypothetical protein
MAKPSSPQPTKVSKTLTIENREAPTPMRGGDSF